MKTTMMIMCVLAASVASAANWAVESGGGSEITFISEAPVESFEGVTDQVTGSIMADPSSLEGPVEIEIRVDLASLDTGIGLRNRHMRENHLHTDEHPYAVFRAGRVVAVDSPILSGSGVTGVELEGELDLHGVVRPMTVRADLAHGPDGVLEVSCGFEVLLSDHGIPRPKFLVMKLADEQRVEVRLRAVPVELMEGDR